MTLNCGFEKTLESLAIALISNDAQLKTPVLCHYAWELTYWFFHSPMPEGNSARIDKERFSWMADHQLRMNSASFGDGMRRLACRKNASSRTRRNELNPVRGRGVSRQRCCSYAMRECLFRANSRTEWANPSSSTSARKNSMESASPWGCSWYLFWATLTYNHKFKTEILRILINFQPSALDETVSFARFKAPQPAKNGNNCILISPHPHVTEWGLELCPHPLYII